MRSSSCGSECWWDVDHVWIRGGLNWAPSVSSLVFYSALKKKRFCCWIIAMHKGRNFSRGEGEEEGMGMKFGWVCGAKTLQFWPCLKAKYIQIATLFKMLNSEIEYFILRLTPKGTIFHIWRQETMHLLMTTYRQDIMTNFSCVWWIYCLPIFQGSLSKYAQTYTVHVLVNGLKFSC